MRLGNIRKLCRHAHRAIRIPGIILPCGYAHPAAPQPEIQKLIHIRPAFQQNILSHNPHIRRVMLHIDCHIDRLHQKIAHSCRLIFKYQLPVIVINTLTVISHRGQKLIHLIPKPSLGQRYIQHVRAPFPSSACSAPSRNRKICPNRSSPGTARSTRTRRPFPRSSFTALPRSAGSAVPSYSTSASRSYSALRSGSQLNSSRYSAKPIALSGFFNFAIIPSYCPPDSTCLARPSRYPWKIIPL